MKFIFSCVHAVDQKAGKGKGEPGHMIRPAGELAKYQVTVAGK